MKKENQHIERAIFFISSDADILRGILEVKFSHS